MRKVFINLFWLGIEHGQGSDGEETAQKMLLPPFQVLGRFNFDQSQTVLSLIKFIEKSSNIFNPRQIYYENIFNCWFDNTYLVL